jgi:hypothetical protein
MVQTTPILIERTTPRRTAVLGALVAVVPLAVAAWRVVAAPTYFDPMLTGEPDLFGIPFQVIVAVFALAWGAIGGYVVGTTSSPLVRLAAVLVFTLPACVALILGPAIILILQNVGD